MEVYLRQYMSLGDYNRYICNLYEQRCIEDADEFDVINSGLGCAFEWGNTPEGFEYWLDIDRKIIDDIKLCDNVVKYDVKRHIFNDTSKVSLGTPYGVFEDEDFQLFS